MKMQIGSCLVPFLKIPIDVYYRIDTLGPGYLTFSNLHNRFQKNFTSSSDSMLALLGIGTGLINYRQKKP